METMISISLKKTLDAIKSKYVEQDLQVFCFDQFVKFDSFFISTATNLHKCNGTAHELLQVNMRTEDDIKFKALVFKDRSVELPAGGRTPGDI